MRELIVSILGTLICVKVLALLVDNIASSYENNSIVLVSVCEGVVVFLFFIFFLRIISFLQD